MSYPYEPPTLSSPGIRPSATIGAGGRFAIALAVLLLFVFLVFPRLWYDLALAQIVVAGPLMWAAGSHSEARIFGAVVSLALLVGLGAGIVWPRWYTGVIAALAIAVWFGIGWLFWEIISHS